MGLDNPTHIAFLLILLLLVFGARRLPEIGRTLGSGLRGFTDSLGGESAERALPAPRQAGMAAETTAPAEDPAGARAPDSTAGA
jgi:sec-independent protein translocase protein TatA